MTSILRITIDSPLVPLLNSSSAYLVLVEHDDARRLEEIFSEREARIVSTHVDSEMAGVLGHALAEKLAARAADPVPAGSGTAAPV